MPFAVLGYPEMDRLRQQMAKPNMMANCYLEFQKNTQKMNFTILTDFSSCIQDDNSLAIIKATHYIVPPFPFKLNLKIHPPK